MLWTSDSFPFGQASLQPENPQNRMWAVIRLWAGVSKTSFGLQVASCRQT